MTGETNMVRNFFAIGAGIIGVAAASALPTAALAQAYPTKPIHLVIPFVAGASSNDIIGRVLAAGRGR